MAPIRLPASLLALLGPGCLVVADPPTSIKLLEPEPEVAFVTPAAAGLVNGSTEVRVRLTSTLAVDGVLYIDGTEVADRSGEAVTYTWDTTTAVRGAHELRAVATDEVDRVAETIISVVVDQVPWVAITSPAPGETLEGSLDVDVSTADDGTVERLALLVDGLEVDNDDVAPLALELDTCDVDDGARTLRVEATDDAGNVGFAEVQVSTLRPMAIDIERTGNLVSPEDEVRAAVAWSGGVDRVWFELDGDEIASWTSPSGSSCSDGCAGRCRVFVGAWDTTSLDEGSYTLEAILLDTTGRTISDTMNVRVDYDADGDGHRNEGYGGDDCDDTESGVHPGAAEVCNALDDDCDGTTDEDFDLDHDDAPAGTSCPDEAWVDCDDADPAVNPDASEICGDGIDNDCDGPDAACRLVGEQDVADLGWASFVGETSGDLVGYTVGGAGDVDGDGMGDLLIGSPTMDSTASDSGYSGGIYIVSGTSSAGNHSLSTAMALIEGTGSEDFFGYSVASLGDVDGDGHANFAVGEPMSSYGSVYLFDGRLSGDLSATSAAYAVLTWTSTIRTGNSLGAGDLDRDGDTDLVVGTCTLGTTKNVGIYRGPLLSSRSTPHVTLSDPNDGGAGCAVAVVPDTDGDGLDDVLMGAPGDATGGTDAGAAWLVTDVPTSSADLSDVDAAFIRGRTPSAQVGWEVSGAGDTDGDGYGDVLLGTMYYTDDMDGHAWLFLGPVSGSTTVSSADSSFGAGSADEAGSGITGLDYDGDGLSDVVVNAPFDTTTSYDGVVSLFYGPVPTGSQDLPADADLQIDGTDVDGWLGWGLESAGDIDGDGCDDLLLGAPEAGSTSAGKAWLLLGQSGS